MAESSARKLRRTAYFQFAAGPIAGRLFRALYPYPDETARFVESRRTSELASDNLWPMSVHGLTPILNVSDLEASFAWFEKWGWKKLWDWGTPPTFAAVGAGEQARIFLCRGAQGGRGRGANTTTFQHDGDEEGDQGVWMSVWVDDVDQVYNDCVAAGLEVTFPPADLPWQTREMHLRHPDGHVFRVSGNVKGEEGSS